MTMEDYEELALEHIGIFFPHIKKGDEVIIDADDMTDYYLE